ncbi:MAG: hypothetical protein K6A23_12915 [Butyrivibrio sp.]|nr:hypothetical protein [Butyrivibrio sp.]
MKANHISKVLTGTLGMAVAAATMSSNITTATVFAADTSNQQTGKPSGEAPSGEAPSGEMPSGEAPSGDMPSGEAPSGGAPSGGAPGEGGEGGGMPGGSSSAVTEWDSVVSYTEDTTTDGESYDSTGTDENAVNISNAATVVLNDATVTRNSEDSTGGDNSSFYGVGAAILTTDGTTYVNGGTITTDSAGGAGAFSYGDGVTYIGGTTISTTQNTSGGIHVAGGGTLYAWDLDVETNGESAAAIRSDRGGGTMVVDGGTYTSNGTGSPAVYVTADISINDASLEATGSEGICIEGLNTLRLFDTDLVSNMPDQDQNDCTWSVILYQSMSGDSEVGNSSFYMVDGSLTSKNGGLFYTTNTECSILLNSVDITAADDSEFFLKVTGNENQRGWGTSGANGSQCNFTAIDQVMSGDVIWDSISTLDFYMTDGSTLTGAIIDDESCAGEGSDGYANVYIDETSIWTVTGDSTITNLYNAGTIVDESGNTVTIEGSDGTTYVEGTSEYTITVDSYSEEADLSGALETVAWEDYEVEVPEELTVVTGSSSLEENASEAVSTEAQTETVVAETETADTAETTEESSSTGLVAAFVAVLAVIAGSLFFVFRKKQ